MDDLHTEATFGGEPVRVPRGGYYDRFHDRPDLDEVARDPEAGNVDFFRRFPKGKAPSRVGPVWAPNFYYRSSSLQILMPAPFGRLRAALPEPLRPLHAVPGLGLVALTIFSYAVCDNDPYREASVAVVIRPPGAIAPDAVLLARQARRRAVWAHVLALPVTTEIAKVRGVLAYGLPKWIADIALAMGPVSQARVAAVDGAPDLTLTAPTPAFSTVPAQSRLGSTSMVHMIDGRWHRTTVLSNSLSFSGRTMPRDVRLVRHGGPLTALLDGLGAGRILRMDAISDAQLVLNMPVPIEV